MDYISTTVVFNILTAVVLAKFIILVLGGIITYLTFRAYRNTGFKPLRSLSIGFGFILLGSLTGGIVNQILKLSLRDAILVQSVFTMVGFTVIIYSLYENY